MSYEIVEVKTQGQFREFLKLPQQIYKQTPLYVQPLNLHMKMMVGKLNSPEKHFFLAKQNKATVARIGAKVHQQGHKKMLHFGFYECAEGHQEATRLLVEKVRSLYPELPLMGPFHFRLEDPYVGVLAQGYEFDPYFLMPYNPPFYIDYLAQAGLKTTMDLFTYEAHKRIPPPTSITESAKIAEDNGYAIRTLDMKKLRSEATTIARIFNDALSKNWGFEEFLDDQVDEMVALFKAVIDPRVVFIVQKDQKDVGCLIMIPNYNPVIKSGGGRLTPSVLWNFFRKKGKLKSFRGYALGVLQEYHGRGVASLIVAHAWKAAKDTDYETCEISWVLASNGPMNELAKHMGGKQSKVYRIFEAAPFNAAQH